jgi:hypothetical protein
MITGNAKSRWIATRQVVNRAVLSMLKQMMEFAQQE